MVALVWSLMGDVETLETLETRPSGIDVRPRVRSQYRPYLDGLRCVAVYLVVAFHAGLGGFAGGFIGVDVFFVLSGYLVTGILLRQLANFGRLDFRAFYARRFRRILPAAAAMLIGVAIVYGIVSTPFESTDAAAGFRAAFWYFANWHFLYQSTNYFASSVNASPVLHFWSLAVEEQFYLTWPLALAGLYLVSRLAGKRQWWALRAMIAVVAIASLAEALHFASTNVDRAYYGTDTRAYQLLAGALIALTPQLVARGRDLAGVARRGSPFVLGALVLVGSSLWDMSSISRGVFAVAATGVLIVGLERAPQGAAARALSWPKVAYLGRISYGTYLWHWPIVVILSQHTHIGSTVMFALTTVLSTVLAAISFHLLEHPIRASKALDLLSSRVIAIALCFSFVAGLLISPAVEALAGPSPDLSKLSITVPGVNPDGLRLLDWVRAATDIPPSPDCLGKSVSKCIVVRGTGKKILLMGDSLARMWIPAFTAIARKESLTLMVASHPGCPWWPPATNPGNRNSCALLRADWYHRLIPQFEPDIVFLGLRGLDAPGNTFWVTSPRTGAGDYRILKTPKAGYVVAQTSAGEQTLRTQAAGALQLLRRPGREVVILEPTPLAPDPNFNPLDCASSGKTDCSFRVRPGPTPIVQFYRTLARTPDVWSLDLNQLVCPRFEVCDPVVDDVLTRRDHTHITGTYSLALSNSLEALLQRERILGRP